MRPLTDTDLFAQLEAAWADGDDKAAGRVADQLDSMDADDRAKGAVSLVAAALWYGTVAGLPVFPLQPRAKTPRPGSHGCHDASTDPDRIRAWWTESPDANIGLATGGLVDVIDIDGRDGVASWVELVEGGRLPVVLGTVNTPRGTHLYVPHHPGKRNRAGIMPGVDYRGQGGYVCAPPSVNADGVPYTWRRPLDLTGAGAIAAA